MIAHTINFLIGLWLAYVSIFGMAVPIHEPWKFAVAGLVMAGLAWAARRARYSNWQRATNIVLGLVLFAFSLIEWAIPISPLVIFWVQLWLGLIVSSLSLWALLLRLEERFEASKAAQ